MKLDSHQKSLEIPKEFEESQSIWKSKKFIPMDHMEEGTCFIYIAYLCVLVCFMLHVMFFSKISSEYSDYNNWSNEL